jgi:hypothetical protein
VALAEVYQRASGVTSEVLADEIFEAEQKIALLLADWSTAPQGIELRARLKLSLDPDNAKKVDLFEDARRATRLEETLMQDRLNILRREVLADPTIAKLWWLQRHLEDGDPVQSWKLFDTVVRPLITSAGPDDDAATKFAKTVVTLVERVQEDPARMRTLVQIATTMFKSMNWPDLAEEVTALSSLPSQETSDYPNAPPQVP